MTLNTSIYVQGPVDIRDLFTACQGFLTEYDEDHRLPDEQQWTTTQNGTWRGGTSTVLPDAPWTMANKGGQGLPAWLMIHYRLDGPLRANADACSEDCDPDDEPEPYHHHKPAHWAEIIMDTTYGYQHGDMGCGDLHAALVARIGTWLDERGVDWSWQNEFTGEIHSGPDKHQRLIDLCSAGSEASAWLYSTVLPGLAAIAGRSSKP